MSIRSGKSSARRRARHTVLTSVLASGALAAATVTTAAVTLTGASPQAAAPSAAPSTSVTSAPTVTPPLADPVEVRDARRAVAPVSLVMNGAVRLTDIPSVALSAYQRAEGVLAAADRSCRMSWTLVAAVGQVVSEHGTRDGRRLSDQGVVRPLLVGRYVRNDAGRKLTDTDAGRLDGDKRHDRAVGPMLLAPTTWSVIGVDSDGDGSRNPQDLDDAALAVAVLLCSGNHDLRERRDVRAAVAQVNDDRAFVRAVLAVAAAYEVQEATTPPTTVVPIGAPISLPTLPEVTATATEEPSDPVTLPPGEDIGITTPDGQAPDDDPTKPDQTGTDPPKETETTEPPETDPTEDPCETATDDPSPTDATTPSADPTDDECPMTPTDAPTSETTGTASATP